MSKSGRKSDGRGRNITPDEAELWRYATRALEPVKVKARVPATPEPATDVAPRPASDTSRDTRPAPAAKRQLPTAPPRWAEKPSAPIAQFEHRKAKRIAAGKVEIGARVDLHGLRQVAARSQLRTFLLGAHAEGHRTVLVVTGKGGEGGDGLAGEPQRGVLRRNVPGWLEEPDLRAIVLSYTQAGVRHGGAGALYVQLRKGR